jgi:hypothetical protein
MNSNKKHSQSQPEMGNIIENNKIRGVYDRSQATYESNDYKFIVYLGLESGNFD